jgi:hypothetical protein
LTVNSVLAVSREVEATFPGKNGKIAYVAFRVTNGIAEIYTINPGGGSKTQITHNNKADFDPSYSPNGMKIAYTVYKGNASELYTIDVGGGGNQAYQHRQRGRIYAFLGEPSVAAAFRITPSAERAGVLPLALIHPSA